MSMLGRTVKITAHNSLPHCYPAPLQPNFAAPSTRRWSLFPPPLNQGQCSGLLWPIECDKSDYEASFAPRPQETLHNSAVCEKHAY